MKVPKPNQSVSYVDECGIEWWARVREVYVEGSAIYVDLTQIRIARPDIERKRVPWSETLVRGHASLSRGWERRRINSTRGSR